MVCEEVTDSQCAERGLLVHMTLPKTADRLMVWRTAAVKSRGMYGTCRTMKRCPGAARTSYMADAVPLRRFLPSRCDFNAYLRRLLRGTCAVQKSGGTVRDDPGRI